MLLQKEDSNNFVKVQELGICAKKIYDSRITHFAYRIKDIVEELKKRTNYIGGTRSTNDGKTLVDTITYSNDEYDLDTPLTKDAMANVFMPLLEFAEGIGESYLYDEKTNTHHVQMNHGFKFSYSYTIGTETSAITINLISDKKLDADHYAIVDAEISYNVVDLFGSRTLKKIVHEHIFKHTDSYSESNDKFIYTATVNPEYDADTVDNGLGAEKVEVVSINNINGKAMEYFPVAIKKGEWIEVNIDGTIELYVCHTQCTSNNKMGCPNYYTYMPFDFRGTIHYILWFPFLNNNGSLHALDTHIENALITYCMYRWFLKVYPAEADRWYAEFERRMEMIKELLESLRGAYGERPMQYW